MKVDPVYASDDLIAEVARQGYDLFGDVLEYAYDDGKPSPSSAIPIAGNLPFSISSLGYAKK